ncbi:MAG: ankyrin repeat domain-containing protein [Candidatus Babeliales bacterium]
MKKRISLRHLISIYCLVYMPLTLAMDRTKKALMLKKVGEHAQHTTNTLQMTLPTSAQPEISDLREVKVFRLVRYVGTLADAINQSQDGQGVTCLADKMRLVEKLRGLGVTQNDAVALDQIEQDVLHEVESTLITSVEEALNFISQEFGVEFSDASESQTELNSHSTESPAPRVMRHKPLIIQKKDTQIYKALASGNPATLQELLAGGNTPELDPKRCTIEGGNGDTPLFWVLDPELKISTQARKEMIDLLLAERVSIAKVNDNGHTVVHEAILSEHPEVAALFPYLFEKEMTEGLINLQGQTPLHVAVAQGLVDKVQYILSLRTSALEEPDFENQTPLQVAFNKHLPSKDKLVIAHALIEAGANMEVTNAEGVPLIFDVVNRVDLAGVELLLGHGANCRSVNLQNHTLLEFAQAKIGKTEKPEVAQRIYDVIKEYVEGKRLPSFLKVEASKSAAASPYVSITVPASLQGQVDMQKFRENIIRAFVTPGQDGASLLQKMLVASLNENKEESHE